MGQEPETPKNLYLRPCFDAVRFCGLYRLIRYHGAQTGLMARVMFFKHGGDGALELADRAADGLMRVACAVFHHHRVQAHQPGFERALNLVRRVLLVSMASRWVTGSG